MRPPAFVALASRSLGLRRQRRRGLRRAFDLTGHEILSDEDAWAED